MLECELKFRLDDLPGFIAALARLGIPVSAPREETNCILDLPGRILSSRHILLRVRGAEGVTLLTVKLPASGEGVKVRREMETEVSCAPEHILEMLSALGYTTIWEYSKTRRTGRAGDAVICIDSLWFGDFVEIEAETADSVEAAVETLGLDRSLGLTETYVELEKKALDDRET